MPQVHIAGGRLPSLDQRLQTAARRSMTYGEQVAIMILTAKSMGLDANHVDLAERVIDGGSVHPTHFTFMESESVRLHNLIASDTTLVSVANAKAGELKSKHGWE